jgi:hypothetical protein
VNGINEAIDNGTQVANMSFGLEEAQIPECNSLPLEDVFREGWSGAMSCSRRPRATFPMAT